MADFKEVTITNSEIIIKLKIIIHREREREREREGERLVLG